MPLWLLIPIIAAIALVGGYLWLIASKPAREWRLAPLQGWDYAHRGLYTRDQAIPENSMAAFERAVSHGYGIELDVQLSSDGQVVVFHDDRLMRMCGVDKLVAALTFHQLRRLSLMGTGERIPLFAEVLKLVCGRVPLIIELKMGKRNAELCRKTADLLKDYTGPYCVESIDPRILRWFRKNEVKMVRGQLSESFSGTKGMPRILKLALRNLLGNCIAKPHFIAYRYEDASNRSFRLCRRLFHLLTVAWTVRDPESAAFVRRHFDLMIFEHFLPESSDVP